MSTPNLNPLEQLLRLNTSSPEFNDQVNDILRGEEYKQWAERVAGAEVVELVDFLDGVLNVVDPDSSGFRACLRDLRHICGDRMALPTSYVLTSQFLTVGPRPIARGSVDAYEGTFSGSMVCVKRVRVYSKDSPERVTKSLYQEAVVWKRLEHKNIVPLLGVTMNPLQLVSEWMMGGDLMRHIGKHTDPNRLGLVCDIADGLHYLHSLSIVHGDLRGPNVLVDDTGHARITNFGLATVTGDLSGIQTTQEVPYHNARWTAPEILRDGEPRSKQADVFSFAMVMIEVFTSAVPFHRSVPTAVMFDVMNGIRPSRPTHRQFTDDLWELMQRCWDQDPESRPEVSWILEALGTTNDPSRTDLLEISSREGRFVQDSQSKVNVPVTRGAGSRLNWMNGNNETLSERTLKRDHPGIDGHPARNSSQHEFPTGTGETLDFSSDPGLLPPKPSIYNMDSGSSLSVWSLGYSIEIPTVITSPGATDPDGFMPSSNPLSLTLAEISAEIQDHLAQEFIDRLDMTLEHAAFDQERHELLNILCKMCSRQRMLPKSMHWGRPTGEPVEMERGGSAIIFQAQHNNRKVAVKTIRVTMNSDFDRCHREFCREAVAWKHLRHPNILPLLGVDLQQYRLSMISEWMDEGNINEYVKTHEEVNRLQLLTDATIGLEYMHGLNMVHGDLKGANILINKSRRACLADFGLSTIASVEHNTGANASLLSVSRAAYAVAIVGKGSRHLYRSSVD